MITEERLEVLERKIDAICKALGVGESAKRQTFLDDCAALEALPQEERIKELKRRMGER